MTGNQASIGQLAPSLAALFSPYQQARGKAARRAPALPRRGRHAVTGEDGHRTPCAGSLHGAGNHGRGHTAPRKRICILFFCEERKSETGRSVFPNPKETKLPNHSHPPSNLAPTSVPSPTKVTAILTFKEIVSLRFFLITEAKMPRHLCFRLDY